MQVDGLVEMDEDATIRCAIQCLQAVTDFRGNEVRTLPRGMRGVSLWGGGTRVHTPRRGGYLFLFF